jgi:hypothetical protein
VNQRLMVSVLISAALVGCSHKQQPRARALKPVPTTAPAPIIVERDQELKFQQPQTRHPVKEGRPPLVYMLEAPARVQVVDSQDGTVLAQAALPMRAIISVDSANGVRASSEQLAPGPIPGQHVYQIFVITGTENDFRTGVIVPGGEK